MTIEKLKNNDMENISGGRERTGHPVMCIYCGHCWTIHGERWQLWKKQRYKGSDHKYKCPNCGSVGGVSLKMDND